MIRAILSGMFFIALLGAQVPDGLAGVIALMRDYARGMTENRFDVQTKITDWSSAGKLRKTTNTTHRMEFTKGRFRDSDSPLGAEWTSTIHVVADHRTMGIQMYADRGIWDPIFAFSPDAAKFWTREVSQTPGGSTTVVYRPSAACTTFEPAPKGFRFATMNRSSGKVTVGESAAIPLRTTFQAVGLPVTSGKEILNSYRSDAEYQMVTMTGANQPFLFPKSATSTWVFADHKVVVECVYTLHTGK